MRVRTGELVRFESVTALVEECRARYATMHVRTATRGGEFLLYVKLPAGERFESLIVHFEGESCYAVMLPGLPLRAEAAADGSWAGRVRRWWRARVAG